MYHTIYLYWSDDNDDTDTQSTAFEQTSTPTGQPLSTDGCEHNAGG
jgi:hypothetical protein